MKKKGTSNVWSWALALLVCLVLVVAGCGSGGGGTSNGGNGTDTSVPTVPSNLTATAASASEINLTWSASTDAFGVTGYKVYRGGTYLKSETTTTSSDTGLIASTQHCYQLSAYDAAGNESAQTTQECATTSATSTPPVPGANFKMPDTGQTTNYTNTFGEDHDYTINPPSYTDNGNGTITDNVTGLIWQKQDDGVGKSWDGAITYCNNLTLAGQTGWRLPSRIELISIVDYGGSRPSINTTYFPSTISSNYWSSTSRAGGTSNAWSVSFSAGSGFGFGRKTVDPFYARCVRG